MGRMARGHRLRVGGGLRAGQVDAGQVEWGRRVPTAQRPPTTGVRARQLSRCTSLNLTLTLTAHPRII